MSPARPPPAHPCHATATCHGSVTASGSGVRGGDSRAAPALQAAFGAQLSWLGRYWLGKQQKANCKKHRGRRKAEHFGGLLLAALTLTNINE